MKFYMSKDYLLMVHKIKTYSQIAKENNIGISTVYRNLKKLNLPKPTKKWNSAELNLLKESYSTDRAFFNKFDGRSLSSIYHKASRNKINRIVKPLHYRINESFFNNWSKS